MDADGLPMDDDTITADLINGLLDDLDYQLSAMSDAMNQSADQELAAQALVLNGLVERLVAAVEASELAPGTFTERYTQLVTKANVLMVGCFWRSMVVANLMRDLGLDLGLYREDGDLELIKPESVSHRV